jgi:Ca2+-binding EF-hand superfamily protein
MSKLLIGGAALLASAAAVAQIAPVPGQEMQAKAERVHTRAEVQAKVTEHFAKLDTNRDGSVTKAEADSAKAALRGQRTERRKERREDRREHAFERLDSNRDNAISRSEWDAHAAQRKQRIASRDHNGDGRPDRRKMHRGGRGMAALGGHMFEMADSNRDGRLTLQEAQTAALRHFDMADANRDGQITPDERRQARERMRAQHRG